MVLRVDVDMGQNEKTNTAQKAYKSFFLFVPETSKDLESFQKLD